VDDYPYGGGRGCVMYAQPLYDCWRHICELAGERVHTICMSPAGKVFTQAEAVRLKNDYSRLILVCGRYEGIDERFIEACVDEELSIGDFVLTGGEIPAMAVADAVCRLVPGVLPDAECFVKKATGTAPGVSAVYPPRGLGGPARAGGAPHGQPRAHRQMAAQAVFSAHARAPSRFVSEAGIKG
jgi:hypothetical protein